MRVAQVVSNDDEEVIERRRFMAACWGDGQPATVLVMLDPAGNLTDLLYAGSFSGPLRRPPQGYDLFMDPKTVRFAVIVLVDLCSACLYRNCISGESVDTCFVLHNLTIFCFALGEYVLLHVSINSGPVHRSMFNGL